MTLQPYERFYNLTETPFALTPDPRFLFQSRQHQDTLQSVLHGLETQKGVITIIGEVGTGKTTLCYTLLEVLAPKYKTALVLDPHLTVVGLLRAIAEDLGIVTERLTYAFLMRALEKYLLECGGRGECVVVLMDEAQRLSVTLLEQIRILSNIQTPTRKLLQIVLVAQTEMEERLQRHELRQLNQRVGVRCYLRPFSYSECQSYIEHRIHRAGQAGNSPFTRAAVKKIWVYSKGFPRLINLACDRALSMGFAAGAPNISGSIADAAIQSLGGGTPRPSSFFIRPSVAAAGLAATLLGGVALFARNGGGEWIGRLIYPAPPAATVSAVHAKPVLTLREAQSQAEPDLSKVTEASERALLRKLLELWRVKGISREESAGWPSNPEGSLDFRLIAARHGLEADFLVSPPWSDLKAIGLPAILKWKNEPQKYLVRLEGERLRLLSADGQESTLALAELDSRRAQSAWIIWRNPDGWSEIPANEWSRRLITLLGARLRELGHLRHPIPTSYDDRFERAVRRFQRKTGLSEDGILGRRTAMTLVRVTEGKSGESSR
ncbi:MAG: AAA family ATPase [Deltaproteobacteria bacterium]|nr:AAA family ATPase [Deltaproteobacteria bacterium]